MVEDMTLRAAEPSDLPALLRATRAFYDEDGFTTSDAELRHNLGALLIASDALVAVADDR